MHLNAALEKAGQEVIETDLGEYIIQLADEPPSHIIAPAFHKTRDQVSDLFHAHHADQGFPERETSGPRLVAEARAVLREKFLSASTPVTVTGTFDDFRIGVEPATCEVSSVTCTVSLARSPRLGITWSAPIATSPRAGSTMSMRSARCP